jgi:hypothetical protein
MRCPTARVLSVIETTILVRGTGGEGNPVRQVTQYWSLEGQLLAEADPLVTGRGELLNLEEASEKENQHGKDQGLRDDG